MCIETIHRRMTNKHLENVQLLNNQRNTKWNVNEKSFLPIRQTKTNTIPSIQVRMQWSRKDDTEHRSNTQENRKDLKNTPDFVPKNYTSDLATRYRKKFLSVMFIAVWLRILKNEKQLKIEIEGWLSKWLCLHTNHLFIENNLLWPPPTWHNSVLCWSCEGSGALSLPRRLEADRYK